MEGELYEREQQALQTETAKFPPIVITISKWGCVVSAAGLAVMMLATTIDVLGRFLFNAPLRGNFELVGFMLIIASTFGLAWSQLLQAHIRITILYDYFPRIGKWILDLMAYIILLAVGLIITWQTLLLAIRYMAMPRGNTSQTLDLPLAPFIFMICAGFAWLGVIVLIQLYSHIREVIKK